MYISDFKEDIISKIPESKSIFESNQDNLSTLTELMKLPNAIKVFSELGFFQFKVDRFNVKQCAYCCLKHLAGAKGTMFEFTKYNTAKERLNLMMDLIHAEIHLRGVDDALSLEINALRIDIFETKNSLLPEHIEMLEKLYSRAESLTNVKNFTVKIKAENFNQKQTSLPCGGCGKKEK